jgi:hypothetical protein
MATAMEGATFAFAPGSEAPPLDLSLDDIIKMRKKAAPAKKGAKAAPAKKGAQAAVRLARSGVRRGSASRSVGSACFGIAARIVRSLSTALLRALRWR